MTQPQDPQDPFRSSTRRFDPEHPTSAYDPADIPVTQHYPGTEQYPGTQYGTAQYGTEQYGQGYGGGGGSDNGRRTKILIGSIIAALVAILLVAFLISVTGGRDEDGPGPVTSETTSATSETSETSETTSETTSPTEQTQPTAPSAPGQVIYRLVGDGNLIVVRYRTSNGIMTAATVRSPWSVSAFTGDDGRAALDAVVVNGSVTCQIVVAGTVIAEGTSSGGPLSCSADIE